ncbi:MAG: OmpA family protein [Brachymonas sp.]|nr:OmpA family protein [Brachymonas sp.]
MKNQTFFARKVAYAASAAALVLLSACAGGLSKVDQHGKTDQPVFPQLDKARMDLHEGTVADWSVVPLLRPGLSRDQLYQLLGRPHFSEGFRVREWDYVLYLGEKGKNDPCQLKVLFDKDLRAQSYHWLPEGCQQAPTQAAVAAVVAPQPQSFRLSADALFAFDSSTLREGAEAELNDLISKIKQHDVSSDLTITGYTDRLGSAAYNQRLSLARAQTVRDYLVNQGGIDASRIRVAGRGEANPLSSCGNKMPKAELIDCLQPDRRVEVTVSGMQR